MTPWHRQPARRICPAAALVLALTMAAAPAAAYTLATVSASDGTPIAWDLDNADTWLPNVDPGRVRYSLQANGSADIIDGSDLGAVERAFATWSGVTGSALRFARDPDLATATTLDDGILSVFWTETSTVVDQGTAATEDDVSVAGALAVAFVYRAVSGPESGEIRDANIVFNGADFLWTAATPPAGGHYDIESVALHEIGHVLGLGHTPVAAATMFPRVVAGSDRGRTLAPDDAAGVAALYPGGNTAAGRGVARGRVTAEDREIFGAVVWARDADGRVVASEISGRDGTFRLAALPPGPVTLHAQPMGDPAPYSLFAAPNLGPWFTDADRDFGYGGGVTVEIPAGGESEAVLEVPGTPSPVEIKLLGRDGSWSNVGTLLRRGETHVRIGAAGPGVPSAGQPMAIPGPGLAVEAVLFGTVAGQPAVELRLSVAPDAPLGPRDIIVTGSGGRAVALGGVEIAHSADEPGPGPVADLRVARHGDGLDLDWQPAAGAGRYRLHRGSLAGLRTTGYDHAQAGSCDLSVPWASLMDEVADPSIRYFLVQSVAGDGQTGSLGEAADGAPRPAGTGFCP